ncbi:aurora kinase B-like [Copidosoma floridanum]|uniref:aurora kinase B-like n=1 Tax=Copidosoma floridanum TaxID=29053 RepID=UPI0006C9AFC0|nr:aurora kinase B-like [Copidosoma floridanum]
MTDCDFRIPQKIPQEFFALIEKTEHIMKEHIENRGDKFQWNLQDFYTGALLGEGKFGRVYLAIEKKTKIVVALKSLNKFELINNGIEKQVLREIDIQSHLKHHRILELLTHFDDNEKIYLVLEFAAGGEVYKMLKKQPNQRFSEKRSAKYIYQVADALEYCHKNGVIHRDIKPENLLLTHDGDIKLADFGWSIHSPLKKCTFMCGTLDYLPPEMINGQEYDFSVDHWSLGIMCYEFLVGDPPFFSQRTSATFVKINKVDITWPPLITAGAKDLISNLLQINSTKRMPLQNVKTHFWIQENIDANDTCKKRH